MQIYPEDILKAVEETKAKAEASKREVQPPPANPSQVDGQWESAKRQRKQ